MRHELKCDIPYFDAVASGDKTFEIRFNDRGFQKGDSVSLRAYHRDRCCYDSTKQPIELVITYVCTFNQKDGWCVFGFKIVHKPTGDSANDI